MQLKTAVIISVGFRLSKEENCLTKCLKYIKKCKLLFKHKYFYFVLARIKRNADKNSLCSLKETEYMYRVHRIISTSGEQRGKFSCKYFIITLGYNLNFVS